MCSRGMLRCSKMLSERDAVDDKTLVPHVSRAATKASPGVSRFSPSTIKKSRVAVVVFVRNLGVDWSVWGRFPSLVGQGSEERGAGPEATGLRRFAWAIYAAHGRREQWASPQRCLEPIGG